MTSIVNHAALEPNEQGQLAPGQMARLFPRVSAGGILFLAGGAAAVASARLLAAAGGNPAGPVAGLLAGLVLLVVGFRVGGMQFLDLAAGRVTSVDGVGSKSAAPDGNRYRYRYQVVETSFQVYQKGTWALLPDGISVRAYYTPLSKTLLHVEPLSKAVAMGPGSFAGNPGSRAAVSKPESAQSSLAKIIELRKLRDSREISDEEFQQRKLELQSRLPR